MLPTKCRTFTADPRPKLGSRASASGYANSAKTEPVITGGCLCGRVRYELNGPPIDMGTCHCRHCQRWSGSAFHSAVAFALTDLSFTKNEPLRYQSSSIMERSFCPSCGSPLAFRYLVSIEDPPTANPETVWISVGSLDEPEIRSPDWHFGVEGQLAWVNFDDGLPRTRCDESVGLAKAYASHEANQADN